MGIDVPLRSPRKGDKLLKINGQDMENLTPEQFAEFLTKGSPILVSVFSAIIIITIIIYKAICKVFKLRSIQLKICMVVSCVH